MNTVKSLGLVIARVVVGALLMVHGIQKLTHAGGFVDRVVGMGAPAPHITSWLVMVGEAGLGALLVLGLATRLAGGLLALLFVAIYVQVHLAHGVFTAGVGGSGLNGESAIMYVVFGLAFLSVGAGALSLDGMLRKRSVRSEENSLRAIGATVRTKAGNLT